MNIETYIKVAETQETLNGLSLVDSQTLSHIERQNPIGYLKVVKWTFSDDSVISFRDETDTEPGWRGHDRCWRFKAIGSQVSGDSKVEVVSKFGNV